MNGHSVPTLLAVSLGVVLASCAPATSPSAREDAAVARPGSLPVVRSLTIAVRVEPPSVATRLLGQPGVALSVAKGMFNAQIALIDDQPSPRPFLVEALPILHTDAWRVFADGRMETTYRLRPNLTWHDGTALESEDFAFAWRVYATPEHGLSTTAPFHSIEDVAAPDQRTLLIRWHRPYAGAGILSASRTEFVALPRHILQSSFAQLAPEGFANHPFWTREYVGLGPYRLDRWEPGAFLEGVGFGGYVLGRPKIERVKVVFISDANTTLANLLAGEVHLATDDSIGLQQIEVLRQQWGSSGAVLLPPGGSWRNTSFQLRPELATPPVILDARVRKALAHAVDKQAINDVVYGGNHIVADSMISPMSEFGPAADRGVVRYPYDLRRSEERMNEAGFHKAPDGWYTSTTQGRFVAALTTAAGANFETEMAIMGSNWRQAGFTLEESVIPAAQARDAQLASSFPSMATRSTAMGEPALLGLRTAGIPRPENRWAGPNRGGWSNPEYDRLAEAYTMTLDHSERARQVAEMARIYSEDLPAVSLFFPTQPAVHLAALRGPQLVPPDTNLLWNVHHWEFR